mmetsp:Transcript_14806/g.45206  ORF Transcript_14806/g.45206 Transcript_14806/m.45206 type:complete len:255 (-) Transcript_14806:562-1326(-)
MTHDTGLHRAAATTGARLWTCSSSYLDARCQPTIAPDGPASCAASPPEGRSPTVRSPSVSTAVPPFASSRHIDDITITTVHGTTPTSRLRANSDNCCRVNDASPAKCGFTRTRLPGLASTHIPGSRRSTGRVACTASRSLSLAALMATSRSLWMRECSFCCARARAPSTSLLFPACSSASSLTAVHASCAASSSSTTRSISSWCARLSSSSSAYRADFSVSCACINASRSELCACTRLSSSVLCARIMNSRSES